MKSVLLILSLFYSVASFSQVKENARDSISGNNQLQEVVVQSSYLKRMDDHIVGVPTPQQRKHAHTGYDLVRNMMIPGVIVNTKDGTVSTPAGNATLYINGREATFREIQSLRPKDVRNIEYYDMPTSRYSKDMAVVNYVMKRSQTGGYTQADGKQGVGFLSGDYNLVSKYSFNNYNVNLWTGYGISDPKTSLSERERYHLPGDDVIKTSSYDNNSKKHINKYVIASLSYFSKKTVWMIRGGLELSREFDNIPSGYAGYMGMPLPSFLEISQYSRNNMVKPALYLYYSKAISKRQNFDFVLDSYYARNAYLKNYKEQDISFPSDVNEDYFYTKLNANYSLMLPKSAQLSFSLHEYLRISQQNYKTEPAYWQHLRSSETILFADYSKKLGRHFMFDANPGLSYLVYRLHGDPPVKHLTPRLQLSSSYKIDTAQRLQLFFALGNTYPSVSTMNHVDQQIDRLMIRRGNPNMDNSLLLGPSMNYSFNLKKWSLLASTYYMYLSNAIINDYYPENNKVINSFSSDARYHQTAVTLSATYKPSLNFNIEMNGNYKNYAVRGCSQETQNSWYAGMRANYYMKDFSFSMSCQTPQRSLQDYQYDVKMPWVYDLTAEWSHGNISAELDVNSLFLHHNSIERSLSSNVYCLNETSRSDLHNQYLTTKFIYTLDYGKKVSKSPEYKAEATESAILK